MYGFFVLHLDVNRYCDEGRVEEQMDQMQPSALYTAVTIQPLPRQTVISHSPLLYTQLLLYNLYLDKTCDYSHPSALCIAVTIQPF